MTVQIVDEEVEGPIIPLLPKEATAAGEDSCNNNIMRRGASASSGNKGQSPLIAVEYYDVEGGDGKGGYTSSRNVSSSGNGIGIGNIMMHHGLHSSPSSGGSFAHAYTHPSSARSKSFTSAVSVQYIAWIVAVLVLLYILPLTWKILGFVYAAIAFGIIGTLWLSKSVLAADDGTPEMKSVGDPIREGAKGFLNVQYTAIARFAVPLALLIMISYQFRPMNPQSTTGLSMLGNTTLGFIAALGFGFGAVCSALSGYLSMWVAAQSNIRVTSAARINYSEAFVLCFRGGAFSAVLNLTLCIFGVTSFYSILQLIFVTDTSIIGYRDIPMLLVGYGFGASFVALFMQLGGGIYTKAADVGADLVGKIEQGIPEDDPRNPAVIADLVGDMVGDCVGSSADVFESVAAEIIGAMILGSTLAAEANLEERYVIKFLFFPLVVHAMDIIVSTIGIAFVGGTSKSSGNNNPMLQLKRGYVVALSLSIVGFWFITKLLLDIPEISEVSSNYFNVSTSFFLCGLVGMLCAYIIVLSTQYYTDYAHNPVRTIAEASTTGHGTNIIVGISVGMKATFIPTVTVAIAVLTAYHLGASTGIGDGRNAGLFGTAVATMGMLSNAVYVLSMNNFGPIADNAGGIAEMSMQPEHVRGVTDLLDAAGNVTKAVTKGYSIGSASMACFLLFGAFMDEFSEFSGIPFTTVDIAVPEVLIGGLLGSMIIFFFTGLAIASVGRTAHDVVIEVRRQFEENPDIMTYKAKPDYERCVSLVTKAALREMVLPGLVCVATPVAVGVVFRMLGESSNRPLLGAEVLAAYLMFGTVTGILMALFLDTTGGAWDNAKKFIELGNYGGKNSEAHKAAITGDTVGDPFKDTAGPSLHVVIKLLSTTILVAGPLFIANMGTSAYP